MDINTELMSLIRHSVALSRRMRREKKKERAEDASRHVRGMGHILEGLSVTEGKSQKDLALAVGIRPQSLSEALSLLEERGEIRRERSG
ncbi:MAG: hypothetical protein IKQ87_11090, partial [Clostridia bacterium]|nr:hypothetical protein [Clostridia bacterium]